MQRVIVLKLGGSILASEASLPAAVHEIFRYRREGLAVVAVVSAFAGETDRRLTRARALDATPHALAAAAALGEHEAAALLAAHLDRAGVPAALLFPAALALRAGGPPLEATPTGLDRVRLRAALERVGVAVVPGFSAVDASGRVVLLGRGGSDLTALFLAAELGARCRLVKDVDAICDRDPKLGGARRYERASWDDALATDGSILQHRAVRFARERELVFEVAGLGAVTPTTVGGGASRLAPERGGSGSSRPPLRVALLGLGTVGGGVWRLARGLPERIEVVAVCNRDAAAADALGVPRELRRADPVAAARVDCDVVVECLGGREPALSALALALERGRDVVTANKRVLAVHGDELRGLASARGARVAASAAVGGCAPVLERVRALRGSLREVRGVLNGSANLVLERLADGASYDEALAEARSRGLLERDPSRDLDGRDAADKLRVIAGELGLGCVRPRPERAARGEELAAAARTAAGRGTRLRQVATLTCADTVPRASVRLVELAPGDPLFELTDAGNAIELGLADGVRELVRGTGAGRWPTAEAVLGDLLELARERSSPAKPGPPPAKPSPPPAKPGPPPAKPSPPSPRPGPSTLRPHVLAANVADSA